MEKLQSLSWRNDHCGTKPKHIFFLIILFNNWRNSAVLMFLIARKLFNGIHILKVVFWSNDLSITILLRAVIKWIHLLPHLEWCFLIGKWSYPTPFEVKDLIKCSQWALDLGVEQTQWNSCMNRSTFLVGTKVVNMSNYCSLTRKL